MKPLRKYTFTIVCVLVGVSLFIFPPKRIVGLDDIADTYFEDSVTKASLAYGTTRLINAGVSVVKESTLQLEPGGVGVAIAVGQVADPLDDMTERLSSVLVTSIVSLLVQKISYEIAQFYVFQLIGFFLVVIALLSLFKRGMILQYRNLFVKIVLFLFVVRLFLPCSALISHQLNVQLFFPRIEEHQTQMEPYIEDFRGLMDFEIPKVKGLGDVFSGPLTMMSEKGQQLNITLALLVANGVEIFNNMIGIMALYLGVFVIQVLFLPLVMFWLLNKLVFVLFSQTIQTPVIMPPVPKATRKPEAL